METLLGCFTFAFGWTKIPYTGTASATYIYGVEGLKGANMVVEESSSFATTAIHLIFGSNEKQNLMGKGSVSLCSAIAAAESDKVWERVCFLSELDVLFMFEKDHCLSITISTVALKNMVFL